MRYPAGTADAAWCTERTAWGTVTASVRGVRSHAGVAIIAGALVACGGTASDGRSDERSPSASVAATTRDAAGATAAAATPTQPSVKPICPATGTWQICSVAERLERAGLAPRREPGDVREPPLSTSGVTFTLGRSELRVFLYSDRVARERDEAKLDRRRYLAATEPLSMQAEPTVIVSENLLAILRSRSDHQRERVSDALTAGPPQTPGTKG